MPGSHVSACLDRVAGSDVITRRIDTGVALVELLRVGASGWARRTDRLDPVLPQVVAQRPRLAEPARRDDE